MYYYGIDIGGTTIKCGLIKSGGQIITKDEIKTRKEENGKYILEDIAKYIRKNNKNLGIKDEEIEAIGLGVPGSVLDNGVVNKCINLGWGVFNVANEFENLLHIKTRVGNDANMAALGEYWLGSAKEFSSMVFITVGTGVGGGIIIDGKPVNGFNGAACEIGHLPIVTEDMGECNCGKKDCLEIVASATGIVRVAKKMLAEKGNNSTLKRIENLTAKDVFDEAKKGDLLSIMIVDYVTDYLGRGLAIAAGMIDPEVFVIGGGVSKAGDYFIDKIRESYKKYVFHPSKYTNIMQAKLLNDAGMYGCAYLAGCR